MPTGSQSAPSNCLDYQRSRNHVSNKLWHWTLSNGWNVFHIAQLAPHKGHISRINARSCELSAPGRKKQRLGGQANTPVMCPPCSPTHLRPHGKEMEFDSKRPGLVSIYLSPSMRQIKQLTFHGNSKKERDAPQALQGSLRQRCWLFFQCHFTENLPVCIL